MSHGDQRLRLRVESDDQDGPAPEVALEAVQTPPVQTPSPCGGSCGNCAHHQRATHREQHLISCAQEQPSRPRPAGSKNGASAVIEGFSIAFTKHHTPARTEDRSPRSSDDPSDDSLDAVRGSCLLAADAVRLFPRVTRHAREAQYACLSGCRLRRCAWCADVDALMSRPAAGARIDLGSAATTNGWRTRCLD